MLGLVPSRAYVPWKRHLPYFAELVWLQIFPFYVAFRGAKAGEEVCSNSSCFGLTPASQKGINAFAWDPTTRKQGDFSFLIHRSGSKMSTNGSAVLAPCMRAYEPRLAIEAFE